MNADTDGHAPRPEVSAHVASYVMRVSNLDRSLTFYHGVFSCRVAIREHNMALLLAPNGFQLYLHSSDRLHRRGLGTAGVQYLMWATENESDFELITQRLRAYDTAVYSHTENGVTFLEGCDPTKAGDHRLPSPPPTSPHRHRRITPRLTDVPKMTAHTDRPMPAKPRASASRTEDSTCDCYQLRTPNRR